jgi:hypothetical protein
MVLSRKSLRELQAAAKTVRKYGSDPQGELARRAASIYTSQARTVRHQLERRLLSGGHGGAEQALRMIGAGGMAEVTHAVTQYTRGGSRGAFAALARKAGLGPVVDAMDYLMGRKRGTSAIPDSAIRDAITLLQNAGFQITPPGSQPPAPPRSRSTPAPPPAGSGIPGGAGGAGATTTTTLTGPSGLPTGMFPGRQYVGMHFVVSSNVYAIGYNPETRTMRVQYLASMLNASGILGRGHKGKNRVRGKLGGTVTRYRSGPGPTYDYYNVPYHIYKSIEGAGSKGAAIWDNLRIRGTAYGHKYDYALVGVALQPVIDVLTRKSLAKVTYVPRRATGPGAFRPRVFQQGQGTFRSLLPRVGR